MIVGFLSGLIKAMAASSTDLTLKLLCGEKGLLVLKHKGKNNGLIKACIFLLNLSIIIMVIGLLLSIFGGHFSRHLFFILLAVLAVLAVCSIFFRRKAEKQYSAVIKEIEAEKEKNRKKAEQRRKDEEFLLAYKKAHEDGQKTEDQMENSLSKKEYSDPFTGSK